METTGANLTNSNQTSLYKCQFNESFKYILLPLSYGIVLFLGLVLNLTALYVLLFKTKRWKSNTIYMFNLAISDTLYIISLPFLIYYYADENDWPFGNAMCKIIRFLFYNNLYCSILFLSCISIHRFLGICYPMRSLQWVSVRRARVVSVAVWVTVVSFQSPIFYFSQTLSVQGEKICYDTTSKELFSYFLIYSSVISVLLFCLPFITVMLCYFLMAKKLQESSAGHFTSTSKKKSVRMIIIVLCVFVLCFLPFHITRMIYYFFRQFDYPCRMLEASSIAYKVTRPLASANSFLDPILYFLAGQSFRNQLTRKENKKSRSNMHSDNALTTKI
ncbi:P2Y purinoceptor 2-like [Acipenser ruthenus]|uniref:P2Y purinoceptor 2-like n=1 Tax=Acipenser ruthenus TaxID=7906 RepID=UPI00274151F5|nr:P2Y purinoceptor 2-like [Acipenser ruthenus]